MGQVEEKIEKSFFDEYSDDFEDYFENYKVLKLMEDVDYKKINKKVCAIKDEFPNVVTFLEDKRPINLSEEEQKAVFDILSLEQEMQFMEIKGSFKLGMKENYIFMESMDMLKI